MLTFQSTCGQCPPCGGGLPEFIRVVTLDAFSDNCANCFDLANPGDYPWNGYLQKPAWVSLYIQPGQTLGGIYGSGGGPPLLANGASDWVCALWAVWPSGAPHPTWYFGVSCRDWIGTWQELWTGSKPSTLSAPGYLSDPFGDYTRTSGCLTAPTVTIARIS